MSLRPHVAHIGPSQPALSHLMANVVKLKSVSKLTITFLVDNTIEWSVSSLAHLAHVHRSSHADCLYVRRMSKLPPGFIHEVPQHLARHNVPQDPRTGVPIIDLENYCCG